MAGIGTWVHVGIIQVQVGRKGRIVDTVHSRRPIAASATHIADGRTTEPAGVEEVIWIRPKGFGHNRTCWSRGCSCSSATFWTT